MNYDTIPSLPRLFLDQAVRLANRPFLWRMGDGAFWPIAGGAMAADV